jgi:hypothetical protein
MPAVYTYECAACDAVSVWLDLSRYRRPNLAYIASRTEAHLICSEGEQEGDFHRMPSQTKYWTARLLSASGGQGDRGSNDFGSDEGAASRLVLYAVLPDQPGIGWLSRHSRFRCDVLIYVGVRDFTPLTNRKHCRKSHRLNTVKSLNLYICEGLIELQRYKGKHNRKPSPGPTSLKKTAPATKLFGSLFGAVFGHHPAHTRPVTRVFLPDSSPSSITRSSINVPLSAIAFLTLFTVAAPYLCQFRFLYSLRHETHL